MTTLALALEWPLNGASNGCVFSAQTHTHSLIVLGIGLHFIVVVFLFSFFLGLLTCVCFFHSVSVCLRALLLSTCIDNSLSVKLYAVSAHCGEKVRKAEGELEDCSSAKVS